MRVADPISLTQNKRVVWLAVGILVTGICFYFLFTPPGQTGAISTGSLGILNQPPTALPPEVWSRVSKGLDPTSVDPAHSHLALSEGGIQIFAVTGEDDQMCMIVRKPDFMASTCGQTGVFAKTPMFLQFPLSDGTSEVAGFAADGFRTASAGSASSPIERNAFWIDNVPATAQTLSVSGPAGSQDLQIHP